ncbi:hypothetical protein BS50DRAFT_593569 [Corynespora cassiicola Philippines]|uniref:Mid2 domain-containing protein n=1 Tax=Corynespora cassiicola Philippines TaxID=1448308 RepID=A0A2T2N602_CORCC|nr:hypothetical protein BS50DRAFT_593569 [Corynespora cassiicola Philippines]
MINKLSVPFLFFAFSSRSWGWEATTTSVSQTLEEPTATWGASVTPSLQERQLIVPVFTELPSLPADWAYTTQHTEKAPAVSIQTTTSPTSSVLFPNTFAPLVSIETSIPSTSSLPTSKTVTQVIIFGMPYSGKISTITTTLIVPASSTIDPTLYIFPIAEPVGNYAMPTATPPAPIIENRGNVVEPASAGQASAEPGPVRGPWPVANKIMRPGYGYPASEPESPTLAATSNWKQPTPILRHPHHRPSDKVSSPTVTAVAVAANAAAVTITTTTTITEGPRPSRTPEQVEEDRKEAKRITIAMGVLAGFLVSIFFGFWVIVFSIQGLLILMARGWRMLKRGAASVSGKVRARARAWATWMRPMGEKKDAEAEEGWSEEAPLPQVPPPAYSMTPKYV